MRSRCSRLPCPFLSIFRYFIENITISKYVTTKIYYNVTVIIRANKSLANFLQNLRDLLIALVFSGNKGEAHRSSFPILVSLFSMIRKLTRHTAQFELYPGRIVLVEFPSISRDIDFATRFAGDVHSAAHAREINPRRRLSERMET